VLWDSIGASRKLDVPSFGPKAPARPGLFLSLYVSAGTEPAAGPALMRLNIWIVLVVLMTLLAVTQLLRYQQDMQRICADDPSASVCSR
jgi:hypothetical protein